MQLSNKGAAQASARLGARMLARRADAQHHSARRAGKHTLSNAQPLSRPRSVQAAAAAAPRWAEGGAPSESRTDRLRALLRTPGIHQGPCCHDALSAKLIEQAGFPFAFMSGFCTSAAKLGGPDTGLITYAEMVEQGRFIHEATARIPVIGDGDTGYGNAMNVKRTVRGYAAAGFAGILIEDQKAPKSCGHVQGKQVVSREEAVARIKAAVDARDEGADILIVARTDARQAVSLEEALWRVQAFAEGGADIVFIDALESEEEMRQFTSLSGVASGVPKMASMLEGGGKTPILPRQTLQMMGFKLVAYPLSLLGVSVRAMQLALAELAADRVPTEPALPSFGELQAVLGFPEYFAESERYAVAAVPPQQELTADMSAPLASETAAGTSAGTSAGEPVDTANASESNASVTPSATGQTASQTSAADAAAPPPPSFAAIEADEIIEPSDERPSMGAVLVRADDNSSRGKYDDAGQTGDSFQDMFGLGSSEFLRVKITDRKTGTVKLETRLPAGWMKSVTSTVPSLAGMDLEKLVSSIRGQKWDRSQPIYETETFEDKVEVFYEDGA